MFIDMSLVFAHFSLRNRMNSIFSNWSWVWGKVPGTFRSQFRRFRCVAGMNGVKEWLRLGVAAKNYDWLVIVIVN